MEKANPYESPSIPEEEPIRARSAASEDEYGIPPFRSPLWIGRICCLLLIVVVFLDVFTAYCAIAVYRLNDEFVPVEDLDSAAIVDWQYEWNMAVTIGWPLFVVAYLLMIFWMYRCHRNLESLGHRELDSKHIWAILCWFVPLLNLYSPFQVVCEIWWRSHPRSMDSPASAPASHLVFWWWLLWVTSLVTSYLGQLFSYYQTWPQYYTFYRVFFLGCICDLFASVLTMLVIYRITKWQLARHASVAKIEIHPILS